MSLIEARLWLKVLIGLVLGLLTGFVLGPTLGWVDPVRGGLIGNGLALPGMLFLAAVQMIVVPFVFASIVLGLTSSENMDQLRRLGIAAESFFVVTTIVILSMVLGTVGIPAEGIALLMGVDRILDMSRTAVNVAGDVAASTLLNRWIAEPDSGALPP